MPRILKAANITLDDNNKVSIAVMDPASIMQSVEQEPDEVGDPEYYEDNNEDVIELAQTEAEQIKANAAREAQDIIADAKAQAESLARGIQETARTAGYEEGRQQAFTETEVIKQQAQRIHEDAVRERDQIFKSVEADIIDLVSKITGKLLSTEVTVNPKVILNLIKQGIAGATLAGDVTLHVSAGDYEIVSQNKDEILAGMGTLSKLEVIRDLSLNKSDCIIETAYGNIDCSLDQQFALLKKDLLYILENR